MSNDLRLLPEWHEVCKRYRYDITRFAVEALGMTEENGQAVTPQQEELFRSIEIPGSRTSVASGHGCFGIDTPIMLANGRIKRVQHITLDDKLMGDDGKSSREVLDIVRGRERMYRFGYDDGTFHVFNESHILCLKKDDSYIELTVHEYLANDDFKDYHQYRLIDGNHISIPYTTVHSLGEGNYYGFVIDGNNKFLGGDGTVFHNTGKSRSAGIVALWHLLFYPESIMMFTAPQIGQLRTVVWKEISICLDRLKQGQLGWLADFVTVLAEKVYIKGFEKTWFVFAKTAPKHNPTNIAGQHGDWYMVWGDEAAGIDDAVMEVAIGALTHEFNRAVLTSQPAKGTGFFYDTHHKLSHKNGGKWRALKFNGEESPIVSRDKIIEALYQYGDRNSPGYLIRIRGEFPELKNEFLLTRSEVDNFVKRAPIIKDDERYGYIITVDVGGGVGRDSSVITVAKVIDRQIKGRFERFVDIVDIPLYSNTADIVAMKAKIIDLMNEYEGASLVVDPIGSGAGLTQLLKADGIYLTEVHWGSACFKRSNRNYYFNKRSHAYVKFAKAVENGWITISDKVRKNFRVLTPLKEQLTRLPYTFDEKSRWQLLGKKDMKKMGIDSPDIGDTLAFIYMEKINYAPAEDKFTSRQEVKDSQEWDALDELAEAL